MTKLMNETSSSVGTMGQVMDREPCRRTKDLPPLRQTCDVACGRMIVHRCTVCFIGLCQQYHNRGTTCQCGQTQLSSKEDIDGYRKLTDEEVDEVMCSDDPSRDGQIFIKMKEDEKAVCTGCGRQSRMRMCKYCGDEMCER